MSERLQNFITDIIDTDLASGKHTTVVTRFPPEPNGYLHIGHAKSICLNFALAQQYGGRCHLRFDDTNPTTESIEYVESIQRDIRWLGFDWGEHLYFASDYYERLYAHALELIDQGKAYVDSLDEQQIREYRGTVTEPGTNSPHRDRSIAENRDLIARMRAGEFDEGAHVVRAKIDMASPNMKMRDPPIYRIKKAHHYRTGDAWVLYPLYDFTHALSDSYEGITHSICTLEFENNRELYDWVLDNVTVDCHPQQIEFARLNLSYTMMSKRKLLQLVEEGHVDGWDDPRMPTIAGLRRRGVTPEAIRAFCDMIGVAKANSTVDIGKLEYCIRDDLNARAPRVMCVLRPLEVVLTNLPDDHETRIDAPSFPPDVASAGGSREVILEKRIYIERDDFMQRPPKDFYRLSPGATVRLRYAGVITCDRVVERDGEVVRLECSYAPEPSGKVKGTIHWVGQTHGVRVKVRLYDRLFRSERPESLDDLNPDSLVSLDGCVIEPGAALVPGARYQFERQGYFCADEAEPGAFNRTVTLRDTWAKLQARAEGDSAAPKPSAPVKPKAPKAPRDRTPEPLSPEARARYDGLLAAGIQDGDARRIAALDAATQLFHDARAAHDAPQAIANWIVNELLAALKDGHNRCDGAALGALVAMLERGDITQPAAKQVLAELSQRGGRPDAIVKAMGVSQLENDDLGPIVDQVLAAHPDEVSRFREGKTTLMGFFVGQVMRASKGRADPQTTSRLLRAKLES